MSPALVNGIVALGYVLLFQMSIIAAAQALPVLAPMAAASFAVEPEYVGYFSTIVFASALVSSTGLAGLLRRLGSLRSAAITLAISGAGVLIVAVSSSVAGLVAGALVLGIAYGPVNPAGSQLLLRVTRGFRRNLVFSIKQTSVAIGGAAAGALLPLVAIPFGWRAAMIAMAAAAFVVAIAAWPVRARLGDDDDPAASGRFQGPIGPARALLADPSLRALTLAIFSFAATQFGLMSVYVTFLWSRAGLPPALSAAMLSLALAASVAGRIGWGWAADSGNPVRIMAGLAGAGVVAVLALLLLQPHAPAIVPVVISLALGFGPLSWSGVFLAEVAQEGVTRGGERGVVSMTAGMMVFGYLGGMLGPACLSLSAALTGGYGAGILLLAFSLGLSAIALVRRGRIPKSLAGGPPA